MALPKTPQRKALKKLYDSGADQKKMLDGLHRQGFKDIQSIGGLKGLLSRMAQDGEIVRGRRKKPGVRPKKPRRPVKVKKGTPAREKKKSYPFPIWSSLLNESHYKSMGKALWHFCLLIDMVTREVKYKGKVYGIVSYGKEISTKDIAERFGIDIRNTNPLLQTLREKGYILGLRGRHGYTYIIPNSKKWSDKKIIGPKDPTYFKYIAMIKKALDLPRKDESILSPDRMEPSYQIGWKHPSRKDESILSRPRVLLNNLLNNYLTTTQRTLFVVVDNYFKKHYKEKFNPKVLVDLIKLNEDLVKYNYKRIPAYAASYQRYFADSILKNGGKGYPFPRTKEEIRQAKVQRSKEANELDKKYGEEYNAFLNKEIEEKGHVETTWAEFLKKRGVRIKNEKG